MNLILEFVIPNHEERSLKIFQNTSKEYIIYNCNKSDDSLKGLSHEMDLAFDDMYG
jgi:hypothetical protein